MQQNQIPKREQMRRQIFIVEQLIIVMILIRAYTDYFSVEVFTLSFAILMVIKYFKQGFKPSTLLLIMTFFVISYSVVNNLKLPIYLSVLILGFVNFASAKSYWFPQHSKLVGFREDSLENGLYYVEFYPLKPDNIQVDSIKWNHSKQIDRMFEQIEFSNKLLINFGKMFLTYIKRFRIPIGRGQEQISQRNLIFSHGKGATPFYYTQILLHFAENGIKVVSVQHTERAKLPEIKTRQEKKKYREIEVQSRAAQTYQAISKNKGKGTILMGHSYGCATIIQAYQNLENDLKEKVKFIVLLDPWFFPLTRKTIMEKIDVPILILANEDFIKFPEIFNRNKEFMKIHQVQYICWKNGHHLHQTDFGFVGGNLFGKVKNHFMTKDMIENNLKAIDMFLEGKKVEGEFGALELNRDYTPEKFHPDTFRNF